MANFNRVILAGNLTRDPQLSMLPSNTPVCDFGMAINRKWKSQSGDMREDTCFVDLRAYGRRAETINQYMGKGQPLLVVENFQFLGGGGQRGGGGGGAARSATSEGADEMPPPHEDVPNDSQIPF